MGLRQTYMHAQTGYDVNNVSKKAHAVEGGMGVVRV